MPISPAMRRLLHIREIQEDKSRSLLKNLVRELEGLKASLVLAGIWEREGRQLVGDSARSGELSDRIAGLAQERDAIHAGALLDERVSAAELHVAEQRQIYLAARMQLRQARALEEKINQLDSRDEARKAQSDLDEWFRSR